MQPLGVRVTTVMAGNVETRFWDAADQFSLPPDSLYGPINSIIAEAAAGKKGGSSVRQRYSVMK
jgi:short-subunit dehydrogenase